MGSDAAVRPQMFSNGLDSAASSRLDRWALARIQQSVASAPLRFLLWDGYELAPRTGAPVATIVFRNRRALFSWGWSMPWSRWRDWRRRPWLGAGRCSICPRSRCGC